MAPLDSRYTQVGFNSISVQLCKRTEFSEKHNLLIFLLLRLLMFLRSPGHPRSVPFTREVENSVMGTGLGLYASLSFNKR